MKKFSYVFILILFLLGACGTPEQNEGTEAEDGQNEQISEENAGSTDDEDAVKENKEDQPFLPDLEETKTVEMSIEGMNEEMAVQVHHHEKLGFSTYVPEDMVVESDDETFNVYTNFQGNKNKDARLFIMKSTEEEITEDLKAEGFVLVDAQDKAYEFSEKEYQLEKEGFIGRVSIFTQNEENYTIAYYYPNEFADGFSTRSQIIVDEIVWHSNK